VKLGFSTGVLYKTHTAKQALAVIRNAGCRFVELGLVKIERLNSGWLNDITSDDLAGFEYVAMHAPVFDYAGDDKSHAILRRIREFSETIRKLDLVVFHPDVVRDLSVLKSSGLPIGIENTDNRKKSGQTPGDLIKVFEQYPDFKLVLDVNHVYTNDPTMKLASDFYSQLGPKLVQVHLSGFAGLHEPLYKTKQVEMFEAIQNLDVPIIVEGLLTEEGVKREKTYIESLV
jgi:hypothetical protein